MAGFELFLSQVRRRCFSRPPSPQSILPSLSPHPSHSSLTSSTFKGFYRRLCSSLHESNRESPQPLPKESENSPVETASIQVAGHLLGPEDPSKLEDPQPESRQPQPPPLQPPPTPPPPPPLSPRPQNAIPAAGANLETRNWTREDIRYMKDVSPISPVSYKMKEAPLPEYRVEESPQDQESPSRDNELETASIDNELETAPRDTEQLEKEGKKIEADNRIMQQIVKPLEMVPFPMFIRVPRKPPKVSYDLADALRQVKTTTKKKYVESVEAHIKLGVNVRRSDMVVRGTVKLPHGHGKVVKVAVFAEGAAADEARAAGADIVGGVELVDEIKIRKKFEGVDRCISNESFMDCLKQIGMILRNLMPTLKKGNLTDDIAKAVKESKQGLIDFKMDSFAIVHVGLGRVHFCEEALMDNLCAFMNAILLAKPAGFKASKNTQYVTSFHLCSSKGPAFCVSVDSAIRAGERYRKPRLKN